MKKPTRERILEAATKLFLRDGYHATGIEAIITKADISRMTLYNHFKSKDELIIEVLNKRHRDWMYRFTSFVESHAKSPQKQLLALFDALQDWFEDDDYYGCAFVNAAAEFSLRDPENQALKIAAEHKRDLEEYILNIAKAAKVEHPEKLTLQICLLIEGAITSALIYGNSGNSNFAKEAKDTVKQLMDNTVSVS